MPEWMIYGASGYTGELIARQAVREGLRPLLAGRDREKIARLAAALELPSRSFALDDEAAADAALAGVALVIHAAGPFSRTSAPMVAACLRARAHYLDITGEISVFEACRRRDAAARERGIVILPGVGFDVVPSDCLARALADALPGATHLELAIRSIGQPSRGTAKTIVEGLGRGSCVRRGGRYEPRAYGDPTRRVTFDGREREVVAVPWGDLATAHVSTAIPDITTYWALPRRLARTLPALRLLGPLFRRKAVVRLLQRLIDHRSPGPDEAARKTMSSEIWGRVETDDGRAIEGRVRTPEGYTFTVTAALACVRGVLSGAVAPGYHTPATAFVAGFVAGLEGASLQVPA